MFILKSTYNKKIQELEKKIRLESNSAYLAGFVDGKNLLKEENKKIEKKPIFSVLQKVDKEILMKKKLQHKRKVQHKYYLNKVKGKVKDGYFRIENGVLISNVTGKPLRHKTK